MSASSTAPAVGSFTGSALPNTPSMVSLLRAFSVLLRNELQVAPDVTQRLDPALQTRSPRRDRHVVPHEGFSVAPHLLLDPALQDLPARLPLEIKQRLHLLGAILQGRCLPSGSRRPLDRPRGPAASWPEGWVRRHRPYRGPRRRPGPA